MLSTTRFLMFCLALLCSSALQAQGARTGESPRTSELFNFGWKFQQGDVADGQDPALNDQGWRKLDLPHDFQIEQPWDKTANRSLGFKTPDVGWYRKTFKADPKWRGKQVLLDFEGIMLAGEVWVNGKKVGGTAYGYLGFETNIADVLNYDGDNVVAVRASTRDGNSRWYTGGGLFRDIHLV